jgi:hypothetical protein
MKAKLIIRSLIALLLIAPSAFAKHRRHWDRNDSRISVGIGFGFGYPGYYGGYYGGGYCYPGYYRRYYPGYGYYPYGGYYGSGYGYPYNSSYGSRPYYSSYGYSNNLIARVQQRLARAGYYRGAIDGVIGPRTRYAIRAYESRHGLPADGRIDNRLLATLGLA